MNFLKLFKEKKTKQSAIINYIPYILLLIFIIILSLASTPPLNNNDIGFHLRIGQEIEEQKQIPHTDSHSYTAPNAAYPDHEWLWQWLMYRINQITGDAGLVVLTLIILMTFFIFVAQTIKQSQLLKFLMISLVLLLGFNHLQIRPHLLSWLFFALLNFCLLKKRYLWITFLFLFWANCHPSVVLALIIASLHIFNYCQQNKKINKIDFCWLFIWSLILLINPNTYQIYTLFFQISSQADFVGEWKPYASDSIWFVLLLLTFGILIFTLWRQKRWRLFEIMKIAILAYLSFTASRNGVVAIILLLPLFDQLFGPKLKQIEKDFTLKIIAIGVMISCAIIYLLVRIDQREVLNFKLDQRHLPVAAVNFIKQQQLSGRVFNDYNFGGYFLWKAWPEYPVFVDGRIEVYQGQILKDYLSISNAQDNWQQLVDDYEIDFFVIRPEREIAKTLLDDPSWDLLYFDYNSVIFARHNLYPNLKKLTVLSPYGNRDSKKIIKAIDEINYLISHNPDFYGGYKILAFLLYRQGQIQAADEAIQHYFDLYPAGKKNQEAMELVKALKKKGKK